MNKANLIEKIAEKTGLNKKDVEKVMESFEEATISTLKEGGEVTLTGFITFMVKTRSARAGVNPRNPSEKIQIPEVKVPKFKAGKGLKDSLKQ